jgi:hypothetical protein
VRQNLARVTVDLERMRAWFVRRPRAGFASLLSDVDRLREQVCSM